MNPQKSKPSIDDDPFVKAQAEGPYHVTWESPVFDLSGYGASSRAALKGLEEAGVKLRLIPARSKGKNTDENQHPH